jgi:hypothetical protein
VAGALDQMLQLFPANADHYTDSVANRLSQYSEYRNYNHTASITFRKVGEKYNLSFGVDFLPQHSKLNYKYMGRNIPKSPVPSITLRQTSTSSTISTSRHSSVSTTVDVLSSLP